MAAAKATRLRSPPERHLEMEGVFPWVSGFLRVFSWVSCVFCLVFWVFLGFLDGFVGFLGSSLGFLDGFLQRIPLRVVLGRFEMF